MEEKKIILFDIDGTLINNKGKLISTDIITTFEYLSKTYTLGIFSQGFKFIQLWKLKRCNIRKYFDNNYIIVSLNKAKTIKSRINNLRKLIIVDNEYEKLRSIIFMEEVISVFWISHALSPEKKITSIISVNDLVKYL